MALRLVVHPERHQAMLAVMQAPGGTLRTTVTLDHALLARAEHLRHGLPRLATHLQEGEVLLLIEREQLMGRGIGSIDAHLLAVARLSHCRLWTQGRRLAAVA